MTSHDMSDQHFYCLRLICLTMAVLIHIGLQLIYGKKRDLLVMLCHMVTNIWVNIGLLPDGAKLNMLTHTCWHFFHQRANSQEVLTNFIHNNKFSHKHTLKLQSHKSQGRMCQESMSMLHMAPGVLLQK